jgi:hypothetical protein
MGGGEREREEEAGAEEEVLAAVGRLPASTSVTTVKPGEKIDEEALKKLRAREKMAETALRDSTCKLRLLLNMPETPAFFTPIAHTIYTRTHARMHTHPRIHRLAAQTPLPKTAGPGSM